jgi:hypothetical protein
MIVFGEAHLRRILRGYAAYYNVSRTHRPLHRAIERLGAVVSRPVLGGLSPSILQNLIFGTHNFLTVIAGREMPLISVGDAMSTLAVVEAVHEATRTGGRISPSNRGAA